MAKERDGGVEIFRCILMFVIVLHHACCHGVLAKTISAGLLFALTIPAVDSFVAISGWYGIRFSWMKVARLWALMTFYLLLTMGCTAIANALGWTDLHPRLHGWWFAGTYLGLMFFSPLINAALDALAQRPKKLLVAVGLYSIAICLDWLPTHLFTGVSVSGWGSHTFNTLLFVYVMVGTIRRLLPIGIEHYRKWIGVSILMIYSVFIGYAILNILILEPAPSCLAVMRYVGYNTPLVWMVALLMFLWFYTMHPPKGLARVCTFLGPSMFSVYLIHEAPIGKYLYRIPETLLPEVVPVIPTWAVILISTLLTFTLCVLIDLCRRFVLWNVMRRRRSKEGLY